MRLKPSSGWENDPRLSILADDENSRSFEVEQGHAAISKGPLETSGLLTCVGAAFSLKGLNYLVHVDGSTPALFIANSILGAIAMAKAADDEKLEIELFCGESASSFAYQVLAEVLEDAALTHYADERSENMYLSPLDTIRVNSGVHVDRTRQLHALPNG